MDYSLYDARRAGFERVIFIIKHSIEKEFHEAIGARIANIPGYSFFEDLSSLSYVECSAPNHSAGFVSRPTLNN